MTEFERMMQRKVVRCDCCGEVMLPLWGGGWDNDRFICTDPDCGAEIEFPTSKVADGESE